MTVHEFGGAAVEERDLVETSKPVWDRLASATESVRRSGVSKLGAPALKQMHEDYRHTAADLAYAQTHFPESESARYLNRLIALAHGELYGARPHRLRAALTFIATGYPRLVRRSRKPIALAAALMVAAIALGWLLAYVDYPLARLLIPEQFRDAVVDRLEAGWDAEPFDSAWAPAISAAITANNIQVSLTAFAGGMTFGALTVYALIANGLLLGVLAGAFGKAGGALAFWALIIPHGSIELPAIVLAGASGLMLAGALLFPGDLPRGQALRQAAPDAVRLVLGALPLLIVAGLIEGFVTPRGIDPVHKLIFGLVMAVLLAAYLLLAGRERRA